MNNLIAVQSFLNQTKIIKKSYDFVAKNTGEKFNLSSILWIGSLHILDL